MISIRIEAHTEKLQNILAKFPSESNKVVTTEVSQWATRVMNLAKRRAPYRTGNLAQSTMGYRLQGGAEVVARVEYAKYVEPEPLGVPMTRNMTRTQFLYNSAMEELDKMVDRIANKLTKLFEG